MSYIQKKKVVWLIAAAFMFCISVLISKEGVARGDWLYIAACPAMVMVLILQFRTVFKR